MIDGGKCFLASGRSSVWLEYNMQEMELGTKEVKDKTEPEEEEKHKAIWRFCTYTEGYVKLLCMVLIRE